MRIGLHIGLREAGNEPLRAALHDNRQTLIERGCAVAPQPTEGSEPSPDELARRWTAWLEMIEARGLTNAILSEAGLGDQQLVRGEAGRLVDALRARGPVRGVAAVWRIDDHVAASYVAQLRDGRTAGLRRMDLIGGDQYNFFARIGKWCKALCKDFQIVLCTADGAQAPFVCSLLNALGLEDVGGLHLPESSLAPALSADAAEALRRFNQAVLRSDLAEARIERARESAYAMLVQRSRGQTPFRLPLEAARELLLRYSPAAAELAHWMSPDEAARFLSHDVPPASEPGSASGKQLFEELAAELDLPFLTLERKEPRGRESGMKPLRRSAMRAHEALLSGELSDYEALVSRVRRRLTELPEFAIGAQLEGEACPIPRRVAQYWDPWPPPAQMRPWMASWSDIGMRGGEHFVATFDQGLATLEEAAGPRGSEAFTKAPHAAVRADLFRYAELLLRGGWYVDAEHEALLPLSDVFSWPVEHVFVRRAHGGLLPNGFFGSIAGSSLLRDILDEACSNVLTGEMPNILKMTGPEMFSAHVAAHMKRPDASYAVLPAKAVFNGGLQRVHNEADYKVHHWRDHDLPGSTDRSVDLQVLKHRPASPLDRVE